MSTNSSVEAVTSPTTTEGPLAVVSDLGQRFPLASREVLVPLGYASLRPVRLPAAVVGLLLVPDVLIVHWSVEWWRSLHQSATLARVDPTIEGDVLVALMVGFLALGLVFTWLTIHRFRVAWLEQQAEADQGPAQAQAEAGRWPQWRRCVAGCLDGVARRRRRSTPGTPT